MQYKKNQSGNPKGRPKGIKDKRTKYRDLLTPHAEELISKLVQLAKDGEPQALRLCIERLIPRAKDEPVSVNFLTDLSSLDSLLPMSTEVLRALQKKEITPEQGNALLNIVKTYKDIVLENELIKRLDKIEGSTSINQQSEERQNG